MAIRVEINSIEIEGQPGRSLFEHAEQHGIQVPTSCLKQGKCRECLMEVVSGGELLSPRENAESHLRDEFRLSCRARLAVKPASGPPQRIKCHTMRRGAMQILDDVVTPLVARGDLKHDPAVTRIGERILLDGQEINRAAGPVCGLAMDLGTTTIVIRLVDLATGSTLAASSFENPQRFGGSDVMARIQYDSDHRGKLLQRTLLGYLAREIKALPVDPQSIYELVVVGNSTMRDMFFGLDVTSIGQKPYRSLTEQEFRAGQRESTAVGATAKQLRLPIHPAANVVGLPLISGHIGSDVAAGLLAIDMGAETRTVALMDIGTNTELVVRHGDRVIAASCPAGPAFEGGSITCGMPGLAGAIERVEFLSGGDVRCSVIGDGPAAGICGSGLIDILAELRRTGNMNEMGRFADNGLVVVDSAEQISVSEGDVSELAQAKGATVAGLRIVLNRCGIRVQDIDVFYLAGGFGRHLDLTAARRIGLIPNLPDEKIVQLGNAAIAGCAQALVSQSARAKLDTLVRSIEHVELETDPKFFDHFVDGCQFTPVE